MNSKQQEDARILANRRLQGDYHQVDLNSTAIAPLVQPGQFVHVRLPQFEHRVLRRPFSVYDVDPDAGRLSIIYKVIGEGTAHLARLEPGTALNLMGPLGVGFSPPAAQEVPIIVAGGYGSAATWLLAKRSPAPPRCLLGGRTREDLLLIDEFRTVAAAVELATDDGSLGHRGVVTDLLEEELRKELAGPARIYACGPAGLLQAVAKIAQAHELVAEISLDHAMCCGVGACFACVVKMKAENESGWEYARTCLEGPVFSSDRVVWD